MLTVADRSEMDDNGEMGNMGDRSERNDLR